MPERIWNLKLMKNITAVNNWWIEKNVNKFNEMEMNKDHDKNVYTRHTVSMFRWQLQIKMQIERKERVKKHKKNSLNKIFHSNEPERQGIEL